MMKKTMTHCALCCFLLFSHQLHGQQIRPTTNALSAIAKDVSEQFNAIVSDTSITFEQVKPFLAVMFESYRAKSRRLKVDKPDTPADGEMCQPMQVWQKQFAQTIAGLSGYTFTCEHKIAPRIESVFKSGVAAPTTIAIKR